MSMQSLDLKPFAAMVHDWAKRKGWWEPARSKTLLEQVALMHAELSEVVEEIRNGHSPDEVYWADDGKPEGVPVELADCVIRILDTCERYEIDLTAAMRVKMSYNETRPYRHGGKSA